MQREILLGLRFLAGFASILFMLVGALLWIWLSPVGGNYVPGVRVLLTGFVLGVLYFILLALAPGHWNADSKISD